MTVSFREVLAALKSGSWLNRRRVVAYSGILLGCELLAFLFLIAGTHGWVVPLSHPLTTDFVSFYAAGHLANAGTPAAAYLHAAHFAAEQQATARGIDYVFFFYPPVFLLICAIFARLPYFVSFVAFETGSLLACLAAIRRILTQGDGLNQRSEAINGALLLPLLAYPAIFINFGVGQNGFLTAALFGGATLLVDRRPLLAGMLFGALCFKPQFGLLVPIALIAGGRWRSFTAAAATVAALVTLSLALFGWQSWHDFFIAITASHTTYESGKVDFAAFVSMFGAFRLGPARRSLTWSSPRFRLPRQR
jgi:alpha-1,2-mannosyltransferase